MSRLWKILNTKSPSAHLRLNDNDRRPIRSREDDNCRRSTAHTDHCVVFLKKPDTITNALTDLQNICLGKDHVGIKST